MRIKDTLKAGRFLVPYRVYENNGPQLVCINGVQQSMAMWHTFVARFSRVYRIVLFDFPNQGRTGFAADPGQVSLDEQVQILRAVMEKAGAGPDTTLCAASWGGVVAVAFASQYPDRVKRLILASLGTKPNKNLIETIKRGSSVQMQDRDQMSQILLKSFGDDLPERIKKRIISQFRTMKEESIQAFYEHGLFVISSKKLGDMINLKNIKAKTILLNGEKDTIIDLDDVKHLASEIPHCQVRIVKGVGHFLHMEREDVLDIYDEILSS